MPVTSIGGNRFLAICRSVRRALSGGRVGEDDVAATEGALIEEAQAALMAEEGASASERYRNDDELILVHEAGLIELRDDGAAAEHGDAGAIGRLEGANGIGEIAFQQTGVVPRRLDRSGG